MAYLIEMETTIAAELRHQPEYLSKYNEEYRAHVDSNRNKQIAFEALQTAAAQLRFAIVMVEIQKAYHRKY
jgi:ABC-type enterochelin transport system substrate-binding protein